MVDIFSIFEDTCEIPKETECLIVTETLIKTLFENKQLYKTENIENYCLRDHQHNSYTSLISGYKK